VNGRPEPGQGPKSAAAFEAWERADEKQREARSDEIHLQVTINRLRRELRAAQQATAPLRVEADRLMRVFESQPYTE
jgi:hypothetical protein